MKHTALILSLLVLLTACGHKGKSVDQLRAEKHERDSIAAIQNERSLAYTDSLITVLTDKRDSLLQYFEASREERYEDYGKFVHKRLTTRRNMERCHLQAHVSADNHLNLCAHYVGAFPIDADRITITADSLQTTNQSTINAHRFTTDGRYFERLTVNEDDASALLSFLCMETAAKFRVILSGKRTYKFVLTDDDIIALRDTYRLYVTICDLNTALKHHDQYHSQLSRRK